jgi:uncharacterized protein (TIGR03435 family)
MGLRGVGSLMLLALAGTNVQFAVGAQSVEAFEVASIRVLQVNGGPVPGCCSDVPVRSGGRIKWITTPALMIQYAYNLPKWRVSGNMPGAIFDLNAETETSATDDRIRMMFQTLLMDRLEMTAHREIRDLNGFAIVQSTKGSKIKAYAAGDRAASLPPWFQFMGDSGIAQLDGKCTLTSENGFKAVTGRRVPISRLAQVLESYLNTIVLDRSGLIGNYYFSFLFLPDSSTNDLGGPDLFTAIQEELGLKLEKQKSSIDILIIDRIDKIPTAN